MMDAPTLDSPPIDAARLPTELLEAHLVAHAAWETAGLAHMIGVLGEFDRRQGWATWGCRNAQQWLSWKCGLGYTAATERLRVAHALPLLPAISAAFGDGHISWSKVRELTRVATPDDDATWAQLARWSTASQLSRLTAARRRIMPDDAASQIAGRAMTSRLEDDGSVTISLRLPADRAAQVLAVVRAATTPVKGVAWSQTAADTMTDLVLAGSEIRTEVHLHIGDDGRANIEDGPPLATDVADCLTCDADAVTTIIHTPTGPIERDRRRGATRRQRRWLAGRHPCCQFPGCHLGGRFEVHHVIDHRHGGATKLSNLVRVCWFHHRHIHLQHLNLTLHPDRTLTVTNADGTPLNRPIPTVGFQPPTPIDPNRLGQWLGDQLQIGWCFDALGIH